MTGAPPARAWVGFVGTAVLWWQRWLRPGFRHCFVILDDGAHWIVVDPLAARTDIAAIDHADAPDLPDRFRRLGLTLVETRSGDSEFRPAPWRPATCVETVKRILGLRAPRVCTPWQLYRFLTRAKPAVRPTGD